MKIEIRDAELEAKILKMLHETGANNIEEVLTRLLETQEEQDRWLTELRESNEAKIQRGIAELRRGEGIPEEKLDAYLDKLRTQRS